MFRFVSAPRWFYGYDVAFDAISAIVVILIALYGLKLYRFSGNKRHKNFSISFFLIGISFLFKSLSNFAGASEAVVGQVVWPITLPVLTAHSTFFMSTYLGYRLFTLLGLLGIYTIIYKLKGRELGLPLFLALVVTMFSTSTYLIFYVTAFIFLLYICLYYYDNWKKLRTAQSKMVFAAFLSIMLAQPIFLGVSYEELLYVAGGSVQLFGYLLLLFSYLGLVVKNGKADKA